jgi:uncharacterized membrane protein
VTQAPSDRVLAAVPPGTTVRFDTRNGAYVHEGEPLISLWPVPADAGRVRDRLAATVVLADPRTMPEGRMLLRPWNLSHDEYVAHAFDQLRQAAPSQGQVVATLLRVLRMLALHAESSRRPELVPVLQSQGDRLLDAVRLEAGLHPEDLARLEAIAHAPGDPADHGAGGHGDEGVADGPR